MKKASSLSCTEVHAWLNRLNPPKPKAVVKPETGICGGPLAPGAMASVESFETTFPDTGLLIKPIARVNPTRAVLSSCGLKM